MEGIMARLTNKDVDKIGTLFESGLNVAMGVSKTDKMKMRRKIRNEISGIVTWDNPSVEMILNRFEIRLSDVFKVTPYGFKEELTTMLAKMIRGVRAEETRKKKERRQALFVQDDE
jgi:hypothetical protein